MRSLLTTLGILIGIAAVMLTVGLGLGAQATITSQINSLGSNLLVITPGSTTGSGGVRAGAGSASTLTPGDAAALADKTVAPDIAGVAPVVQRATSLTAGGSNWTTTVVGSTPDFLPVRARTVGTGRFITAEDVSGQAAVVVLGSTTAQNLFGSEEPIGRTVTAGGSTPLTVIGVLAPAGASLGGNQDDTAIVPLTTAADRIIGGSALTSVQNIFLAATSQDTLSAAYQEATQTLLVRHRDRRLHHRQPAVHPRHRLGDHRHHHRAARRRRRDLAAGRRHRRHEHHAGLGHRADLGDRPAQGPGREPAGDPAPVPGRGLGARLGRRHRRHRARAGRLGDPVERARAAGGLLLVGDPAGGRRVRRDRPGLRRLPGRPRGQAGAHRRAAERVSEP
jgi:hypothetical protein